MKLKDLDYYKGYITGKKDLANEFTKILKGHIDYISIDTAIKKLEKIANNESSEITRIDNSHTQMKYNQ